MTRITKTLAEDIVDAALRKAGIPEARKALIDKEQEWAERCRIQHLGGPEKAAEYAKVNAEARRLYAQLPAGLRGFNRIANVETYARVNVAGQWARIRMSESRICSGEFWPIAADDPLAQQWYDLCAEREAIDAKAESVKTQVHGVVSQFTTVAKLLAAWPEAEQLLPAEVPSQKPTLPAVRVEDLNKALGLP